MFTSEKISVGKFSKCEIIVLPVEKKQTHTKKKKKKTKKLDFVFYVKTDVSPLSACPKYASKSYSSCASHILSFCFISVPSFIEISLTVFKL